MLCFQVETLSKLGLLLYLLNSNMKDYTRGILRKLSHNGCSSIPEGNDLAYLDHCFSWWSDLR